MCARRGGKENPGRHNSKKKTSIMEPGKQVRKQSKTQRELAGKCIPPIHQSCAAIMVVLSKPGGRRKLRKESEGNDIYHKKNGLRRTTRKGDKRK